MGIEERVKLHLWFVADIHVIGLLEGGATAFLQHWGPTNELVVQ